MASKSCANCKYSHNDPNYTDLQCRKYPPVDSKVVWVARDWWCGEFVTTEEFPYYDINDRKTIWI